MGRLSDVQIPNAGTMMAFALMLVCGSLGLFSAEPTPIAAEVYELVATLQDVGLPVRIDKRIAKSLDPLVIAEFEDYRPVDAFFIPQVLTGHDDKLRRKIESFWSRTSYRSRLRMVPDLMTLTLGVTNDDLRDALAAVLFDFMAVGFDVVDSDSIVIDSCLRAVESNLSNPQRIAFLKFLIQAAQLNESGAARLITLAQGRDRHNPEVLEWEIEALGRLSSDDASPEIIDFLVEVSEEDPCGFCRVRAIGGLRELIPRDDWRRLARNALAGMLESQPRLAADLVFLVAVRDRDSDAAPLLVAALDSEDLGLRGYAINGLEKVFSQSRDELGYDFWATMPVEHENPESPKNARIRLSQAEAVQAWKEWWGENCGTWRDDCPVEPQGEIPWGKHDRDLAGRPPP